MTPEENITTEETTEATSVETPVETSSETTTAPVSEAQSPDQGGEKRFSRGGKGGNDRGGRGDRRDRGDKRDKPKKEFDELLLEVRRVTRVTTGGRRMSFRATVLVGNKKGKIGLGVAKGNDVAGAVAKATNEAYKTMFQVPIAKGDTVPYILELKYKAAIVRLLPASEGTGLKAGSSIRSVLELAGYSNMLSKMIGSNNKLNNALATIKALASYKHAEYFEGLRTPKVATGASEEKTEAKKEEETETKPEFAPKTVKKAPAKKTVKKEENTEE
ncbi:hypothetical protein AGMMS50249_6970 [candidate division SR1 bacterium]|nr:hypothetical protein AGMMS50249_6970 [candidate division SR1 bacterium]